MVKWIAGSITVVGLAVSCVGVYHLALNPANRSATCSIFAGILILATVWFFYPKHQKEK